MSITDFVSQPNIHTLWEVITETVIFKFLSKDIQKNVYGIFINNISPFYKKEKQFTNNLIEINKKFIIVILNYIKEKYPEKKPNKIKILPETNIKESITYEEIHNDRVSEFEKKLTMHEENFRQSISVPIPPVPDFLEKSIHDKPIESIELILQEMISKRNYDTELFSSQVLIEEKNEKLFEINLEENNDADFQQEPILEAKNMPKKVTWGNNELFNFANNNDATDESVKEITSKQIIRIEESIQLLDAKLNIILSLLKK